MEPYTFKEQKRCEIWLEQTFTIEAETYEEALDLFRKSLNEGEEYTYSDDNQEFLFDTCEEIESEYFNESEERIR